jgi:hypothetical protein
MNFGIFSDFLSDGKVLIFEIIFYGGISDPHVIHR